MRLVASGRIVSLPAFHNTSSSGCSQFYVEAIGISKSKKFLIMICHPTIAEKISNDNYREYLAENSHRYFLSVCVKRLNELWLQEMCLACERSEREQSEGRTLPNLDILRDSGLASRALWLSG